METIYSYVIIYWLEGDTVCSQARPNTTLEQAKAAAEQWGCKFPKWWQFWLTKPVIVTTV
jgi:hypothetical protein